MKKGKLKLGDLKVQSFVTALDEKEKLTFNGEERVCYIFVVN